MSKIIKTGAILTILGVVMGLTNPNLQAYQQYTAERLLNKGEDTICKQTDSCELDSAPNWLKNAVNTMRGKVAQPALEKAIASSTKHQNLFFLSFYTTELPGLGTMKTVGAFGHFFTYGEQ